MVLPMLALAVGAVLAGYVANPQWIKSLLGIPAHWFSYFVESAVLYSHPETPPFNWAVAGISTAVALAGIALAYLLYARTRQSEPATEAASEAGGANGEDSEASGHGHFHVPAAPQQADPLERGGLVYTLLARKYFVDELYEGLLVRRVFYRYFAGVTDWLDRSLVDGIVDFTGWTTRQFGRLAAQLQTGQVQFYGAVIVLGAVLILVGYIAFGTGLGG